MTQPPSGQPQRNPLRAALERFGRERRGQPQIHDRWCASSQFGVSYCNCGAAREARPEQGQPQQEPAPRYSDMCDCGHDHMAHSFNANDCYAPDCGCVGFIGGTQERQAGGHVHDVLQGHNHWDGTYFYCHGCDKTWDNVQQVYEQGVADAAAQAKEQR